MSKIVTKAEKCAKCEKIVYSMEELKACDKIWHKQCFKCVHCGMVLSMKGFAAIEGDPYCKPHFLELFKQKGSYATFKEGDEAKSNSYNPITSFQGLHAGAAGTAGERKSYFPAQPKSPRLHDEKSPKTPTPSPVAVASTPPPAAKKEEPKKEEPKKEEPKKEEPKKEEPKKEEPKKEEPKKEVKPIVPDTRPPKPKPTTLEDTPKEKRNSGSGLATTNAEPETKVIPDKRSSMPPKFGEDTSKVEKKSSVPPLAKPVSVDDSAVVAGNKIPKIVQRSGSAQALGVTASTPEEVKPTIITTAPVSVPYLNMQKRPSVLEREVKDSKIRGQVFKLENSYTGKWLSFKKIQYTDPNRKIREWESVERTTRSKDTFTDAVCLFAIVQYPISKKDPSLVVVKQFRPALNKICLEMPAGLLGEGENEETGALRELREETGYIGKVVGITSTSYTDPGLTNASCAMVTVEIDGDDAININPKAKLDDGEFITVDLIPLATLYGTLQDFSEEYAIDSRLLSIAVGMNAAINQSILPSIQD